MSENKSMRVGVVGLGRMGQPIARRLAVSGLVRSLAIYDRSAGATEPLATMPRVVVATSPMEVADRSDLVITCLPTEAAVRDVFLGELGLATANASGLITCDCSTVSPALAKEIAAALENCGMSHLDTPLFGDRRRAAAGTLYLLVSGSDDAAEHAEPVLRLISSTIRYVGPSGTASAFKVMQNGLGYISAIATVEILGLCSCLGIESGSFIKVVRECGGIGNSAYFERISHHLVEGTDAGDASISIPAKDIELLVAVARKAGLTLPLLQQCAWYFEEAVRRGWEEEDVARIGKVLEAYAGSRLFGNPSDAKVT